MKKTLYLALTLSIAIIFSQCKTREPLQPTGKYTNGVLILNEGNFSSSNGNLSFFEFATNSTATDIIRTENSGTSNNALVQNAVESTIDSKICVVTNLPDQLQIFNSTTLKNEAAVTGLANPFDVAIVNGKAYITEWGTNYFTANYANAKIQIVNLSSRQIVNSITVGKEVNGILAFNGKVYVAITGENRIWVINPTTDQLETTITTSNSPSNMEVDINGKIWVLCSSGSLVRINPTTNTVEATISGVSVAGYSEKIVMNNARNKMYWLGSTVAGFTSAGIFQMDITGTTAPTSPLVSGSLFYAIGFSASRNQIVAGILAPSPNSYSSNGEIGFYNTDGSLVRKGTSGGVAPNGFLMR